MSTNIIRCCFTGVASNIRNTNRSWHLARSVIACPRWQSLHLQQTRHCTAEALAPAQSEGIDKDYAPKITKLVEDISQLTLMEVADLNELLKKTLNITDTPMMAMGAMPAQAREEDEDDEADVRPEKVAFTVKLTKFDETRKVAIIKAIKALIPGTNLVQAKKFVESLPQTVKAEVTKDEAEELKKALETEGGTVQVD